VGYGVMDPDLADYLDRVRQPYNSSAIAQAAALAALDDREHVERSREMNKAGLAQLQAGITSLGFEVIPSQANFVVVRREGEDGGQMQEALRGHGILVRAMGGYGMPDSVRITVGTRAMNDRVIEALKTIAPAARTP
jgi:histidinol-phosphate aminotransferase